MEEDGDQLPSEKLPQRKEEEEEEEEVEVVEEDSHSAGALDSKVKIQVSLSSGAEEQSKGQWSGEVCSSPSETAAVARSADLSSQSSGGAGNGEDVQDPPAKRAK